MRRASVFFLFAAVSLLAITGCGNIEGLSFPYVASPRVEVQTPASPAEGNVTITFNLIDREVEPADITVEYSTNGGTTYSTATLTIPGDVTNLASAWHPGRTHTVTWNSVTDMVGRSGAVSVCVKITPSDASNPSGTPGISGSFTVNNIAYNEAPTATAATPAGVQTGNVQINYFLADVESDTCSIAVLYSTNDGTSYQAATMGPAGDGVSGLSSSPSGTAHVYLWDSRADNVAPSGQVDTIRIRITPTDFNAGTAGDTNSFSVDNSVANDPPTVAITGGPADGSTVTTTQVAFTWSGSDTDGSVVGYYYSFDHDPPDVWTTDTTVTSGALSEASHIFRVVSVDDDSDLSTVASRSFTVETTVSIHADFTASPTSGEVPLTVNFTDLSTSTNGIDTWSWDFGDSETSTQEDPTHQYIYTGARTVSLTVTGPDGSDTETKTAYINVVELLVPPQADFRAVTTTGSPGANIQFSNMSCGQVTLKEWDFDNDGSVDSNSTNPSYTYDNAGWYSVKLTVTGPGGTDSRTREKYILIANGTCHVDSTTVHTTGDGSSWAEAFQTIQEGLDAAGNYDLVLVADGTYTGTSNKNLDFAGKAAYLKAYNLYDTRNWTIDCENSGRGFFFHSGETTDTVINGFTIANGRIVDESGGGIYCQNSSSPHICSCVIKGCEALIQSVAGASGGGIYCVDSSPLISKCFIINNTAGWSGGGIRFTNSNVTLSECIISNNTSEGGAPGGGAGGGIQCNLSDVTLINCILSHNEAITIGGGLRSCQSSNVVLSNCTIANNTADIEGGGINCWEDSSITLRNSIIWGNTALTGGNEIYTSHAASSVTLNYCDYANGAGDVEGVGTVTLDHCINSDPSFVDAVWVDFYLQAGSPCVDAGDNSLVPAGVMTDIGGAWRVQNGTVDMGAYERNPDGTVYSDTCPFGAAGDDDCTCVCADGSDNIYLAGRFGGTINFAAHWGGSDVKTSGSLWSVFITRVNADDSYGWTCIFGGTKEEYAHDICTDSSGNIYVAGQFEDTVNFAADWGGSDVKTSAGAQDLYITKINANGSYGWTRAAGVIGSTEAGQAVCTDTSGNVYVAGIFHGSVNFAADWGSTDMITSAGSQDIFIMRINANGTYGWTHRIGGTYIERPFTVCAYGASSIYVAGEYRSDPVDFAGDWSGGDSKPCIEGNDAFITKIGTDGSYGWTRVVSAVEDQSIWDSCLDSAGNLYLAGYFRDTVNFAGDWGGTDEKTGAGMWDMFVTRVNADGSYGWTRRMGNTLEDVGTCICVDAGDNVYFGGYFGPFSVETYVLNFAEDWGGSDNVPSTGSREVSITKIRADGTYAWTHRMGGTSADAPKAMCVNSEDTIFVVGYFNGTVNFAGDWGGSVYEAVAGSHDMFFARIEQK